MSLRTQSTMHFTLLSKNVLSPEEQELYELADLAGVVIDPSVFKIVLDLLKMNVAPTAVLQMLKSMCGQRRRKAQTVGGDHSAPDPSSHLPAQVRDDGKSLHSSHRVRPGSPDQSSQLPARSRDDGKSQHSSHRVRSGSPDKSSQLPARSRDDGKSQHSSHRVRSGSHGRTMASSRSDPRK